MRGSVVLVLVLAAAACQSVRKPVNHETRAQLASSGFVTLARVAEDLDLDYFGEDAGFIELSAPPDHVMLVRDSRQAVVNGATMSMEHPCMRRGDDYVLSSADVARLSRQLESMRETRREVEPLPPVIVEPPSPEPRVSGLPSQWRPFPQAAVRDWRYIVIHHTATAEGSAAIFHRMHQRKGWDGLGYHFVVGNGSITRDGQVEVGYRWRRQIYGAHARAKPNDDNLWNLHGVGISLVGDFTKTGPSPQQMDTLVRLVKALRAEYDIPARNVVPHCFVTKTACPGPNFPWEEFMARIR